MARPEYLPWRGYFAFINTVDLLVIDDDGAFTTGDPIERTALKTPRGREWLTIPTGSSDAPQRTCAIEIDYRLPWRAEHRKLVSSSLGAAPYVSEVLRLLDPVFAAQHRTLSNLNVALVRSICDYLSVQTPLIMSSDLDVTGSDAERQIELLTAVGATTYVVDVDSAPSIDERPFRQAGLRLEYRFAEYAPYPQLWGRFDDDVSVIDLIASCGRHARHWLTNTRRELAVA